METRTGRRPVRGGREANYKTRIGRVGGISGTPESVGGRGTRVVWDKKSVSSTG